MTHEPDLRIVDNSPALTLHLVETRLTDDIAYAERRLAEAREEVADHNKRGWKFVDTSKVSHYSAMLETYTAVLSLINNSKTRVEVTPTGEAFAASRVEA